MITLGELDKIRSCLADHLRLFQNANAVDIGTVRLRKFAAFLDTERQILETALENEEPGKASRTKDKAMRDLIKSMMEVAKPARDLARLVKGYAAPMKPGDIAGLTRDLKALREQQGEIEDLTSKALGQVDATKKVLSRPSRGTPPRSQTGEGHPYRCEPMVAAVGYRR